VCVCNTSVQRLNSGSDCSPSALVFIKRGLLKYVHRGCPMFMERTDVHGVRKAAGVHKAGPMFIERTSCSAHFCFRIRR
jgi:hypothetical protein